jgi:hypothetical protein
VGVLYHRVLLKVVPQQHILNAAAKPPDAQLPVGRDYDDQLVVRAEGKAPDLIALHSKSSRPRAADRSINQCTVWQPPDFHPIPNRSRETSLVRK